MRHLLIRWGVLTVAIALAIGISDSLTFDGGVFALIGFSAVLGLLNAIVRPVIRLFTLPITVATLGLFSLVINAVMLIIAANLSSVVSIESFLGAIVGALLITVISAVLNRLVDRRDRD